AEGGEVAGLRVLVVEDVVTSGGQVVLSTGQLRHAGSVVTHALCVIDRQAGGREALAEVGVELRALFTKADLEAAASS
ncbi:MAG: orotate phosphoribosyltransferase, partial [Acidimicrobiales bacterium]